MISGFLISLAPGETAAPKGFDCSTERVWAGLAPAFWLGAGAVGGVFELEENLELMLVIQELRLPKEGDFGSFGLLAGEGELGVDFSELERGWREGM